MADNTKPHESPAAFVESALAALLAAPHISFPSTGPAGIHLGPGPIDLFSTKFNNTFTGDATGFVDGKQVDRAGLKETLLALQTHYDPDTVKFRQEPGSHHHHAQSSQGTEVDVSFAWVTKDFGDTEVSTAAVVVTDRNADKISTLALKGKPELFVRAKSA